MMRVGRVGRIVGRIGRTGAGTAAETPYNQSCLSFGGTDEYASRADAAAHDFTTALSISCWVKAASNVGSGIVAKADYGNGNLSYYLGMDGTDSSKVLAVVSDDGSTFDKQYRSSVTVFDGTWHHVAMTFGSSTLKVYIDGAEDASVVKASDNAVASLFNSNVGLRFGSLLNNGSAANFYVGQLCSVSLWSKALSAAEVSEIYSDGITTDLSTHSAYAASCVSWYKAGDGDSTSASGIVDTKGALHLSTSNMEASDIIADAPGVPYSSSYSIAFGGTNEYLSRAHHANHNFTTAMSIIGWVKAVGTGTDLGLVSKGSYSDNRRMYTLYKASSDATKMSFLVSSDGTINQSATSSVTVFDNTWKHVAITYNAGTVKMYINGVEDTSVSNAATGIASLNANTTDGLWMGAWNNAGSPNYVYVGSLDEVALFSVVLSQAEVTEAYNAGATMDLSTHSQYANCRSWYRLGDGDTIGASGVLDVKGGLSLSPSNMETADIVADAPGI